jgi:hypothetical protein
MDQALRMANYREADRILVNDEVLVIPMASGRRWRLNLIQPWVHGWESNVSTRMDYTTLHLERE